LVRHGRALELTPRALRMLPSLERGLSDLTEVVTAEPAFDPKLARKRFTLAMADYQQGVLLTPLLRAIEHSAPNVDLSVVGFPDSAEMLEAGSVDLALIITGALPATFSTQPLFSDKFVCLVRKGHPRVTKKLSLEAYLALRHVLVAPGGAPGSIVDSELARRGLERRIALSVSSFLTAPIVVSETDFIATLPERIARRSADRFPVRLLEPPLRLPSFAFSLAWHPRQNHDPAQQWLRGMVKRVCAAL
jgi:DNA-binding transcriptional LysR family regulator